MSLRIKREEEKAERHEKRRLEILEAAERLFQLQGIRQTKMTDIARACELGKGTLYFYFRSKDEIVWKLLAKHSYDEHLAGMAYINSITGNGYEKLASYFELFTKDLINTYDVSAPSYQYREYMVSMVSENKLTDEMKIEYKALVDRNMSAIEQIIEEGINDGSIKDSIKSMPIGNAIGTAFGTYFRYVIGLKASFDDDYVNQAKESFKTFTLLMQVALKR